MTNTAAATHRQGLILGVAAYLMWGLVPLFFKLLHSIAPAEIVAHRIVWSVLLLVGVLGALGRLGTLWTIMRTPSLLARLTLSAALIFTNWLVYIWSVTSNHLLASSLGYFLNPLVNVALGVVLLSERLTRAQVIAISIAGFGVMVAAATVLSEIWISVTLACSFGFYGLVRKITPVPAIEGLAIETMVLAPLCLVGLGWSAAHGWLGFGHNHGVDALLIASSAVTSVPLIVFAAAARRIPYATMGLLQFIAPSLVFIFATTLYHEPLRPQMAVAFGFIWVALGVFVFDLIRGLRTATA